MAVLPILVARADPEQLFAAESPAADPTPDHLNAQLGGLLRSHPYVTVTLAAEVRQKLAADPSSQALSLAAQQRYRLGLDLYMGLKSTRAVEQLRESVRLYLAAFQDVIDPRPVADALFMLGVSLIDGGQPAEAHIALKQAFQLQPNRRFRANFFPARVNQALIQALIDQQSTGDPLRPYGDNRRLASLAQKLDVAWLLAGTVRRGSEGSVLSLGIFGAQRRLLEAEARLPVDADQNEQAGAFVSRWLACTPVPTVKSSPRRSDEIRVDTGISYLVYARQPTRRFFQGMGFGAGITLPLRPALDWFARVSLYTSISDPYRDLLLAFNSVRLVSGLSFSWKRSAGQLYLRPGIDVHVLGSFVASTDPECKLFGVDHPLCDPATLADLGQDVLVGGHLTAGGQLNVGPRFFVSAQAAISSYVLPLTGTDRLNFPLSGDVALGYRF